MSPTLVSILAVILGSLLTAALGALIRRARPVIIVDEIGLWASPTPQSTVAVPNLGLAALCADSEFVTVELGPRDAIDEAEYVVRLRKALDEVKTASADLPALHEVAVDLNECLQRGDFIDYAEIFSRESPRIWPSLISARGRGGFDYCGEGPPPIDSTQAGEPGGNGASAAANPYDLTALQEVSVETTPKEDRVLRHESWASDIVIDADGEFIMPIDGPRDLGFPWTKVKSGQRAKAYAFAMRTAVAVAAEHKADLQQLTSFLLKIKRQHAHTLEEVQAKLEAELKRYDRLRIKGIIANRGGSPVSAINTAQLFVRLAGQTYVERLADGKPRSLEHKKDEKVKMRLGSDDAGGAYDFDSSLTVEGKGVTRFIASSTEPVSSLRCNPALLAAMTGGGRECYLGVMVVSPRSWWTRLVRDNANFSPCYTDPLQLRNSEEEQRIPRREEWRRRSRIRAKLGRGRRGGKRKRGA